MSENNTRILKIYRVDDRKVVYIEYFSKCSLVCHCTKCLVEVRNQGTRKAQAAQEVDEVLDKSVMEIVQDEFLSFIAGCFW